MPLAAHTTVCRTVGIVYEVMWLIDAECKFSVFCTFSYYFHVLRLKCAVFLSLTLQARSYSCQLLGAPEYTVST